MASRNKHFNYGVQYTYSDKTTRVFQGSVTCNNFHDAVKLIMDDEGEGWAEKRATKQILFVIQIPK